MTEFMHTLGYDFVSAGNGLDGPYRRLPMLQIFTPPDSLSLSEPFSTHKALARAQSHLH